MKTDGSGALHSETQAEDEGGEGAQAATLSPPVGEDRVNTQWEQWPRPTSQFRRESGELAEWMISIRLGPTWGTTLLREGKDDVEELADKVDCWAKDYWMAVEEWELEKLFNEPQKTRSGRSMVVPIRYR